QSFLALLAFAMFSCRFCFFFCSRSLASIILASFQDNRALAINRGVNARITVVRKPYGSLAAHSTTYSAHALISIM
ncbi:small integral membrane protein 15, partial [Triplophysa rosa]